MTDTAASISRFVHPSPPIRDSSNRYFDPSPLQYKLVGDVLVAGTVTACAAPFLTIIDKALVEKSAGARHSLPLSMFHSLTNMLRHPLTYFRSPTFLYMWATYACTYTTANTLRTLSDNHNDTALFLGTTAVNSSASIVKDRAYAKLFGTQTAVAGAVPRVTYGLWMARDVCAVSSSFLLPQHIAKATSIDPTMAQMTAPVIAQMVAGPLHYCGYDIYNNRALPTTTWRSQFWIRWTNIRSNYWPVVSARMLRILPTALPVFGIQNY